MAPKKRPCEQWFNLAPYAIGQEHETPQDDYYVPKDDLVIAWSIHVVKASHFKILLVVKLGKEEQHMWSTITEWKMALVQALGSHIVVILENCTMQNAHIFMQEQAESIDPEYVKDICAKPEVIKPEIIFIDKSFSNKKVATRFTKLKHVINAANKAQQSKSKFQ